MVQVPVVAVGVKPSVVKQIVALPVTVERVTV